MDSAVGSTAAVCCVLARCVLGCDLNRAAPALRDCLDLVLPSARVVSLIFLSPEFSGDSHKPSAAFSAKPRLRLF